MKTIIHYKNGQSYTINDLSINYTYWEEGAVVIVGSITGGAGGYTGVFHDVLYIEEVDKDCGVVKVHFSPDVEMSVKVDVMTAKERSKANRKFPKLKFWRSYYDK
jgi:hypothetical protein